MATSVDDVVVVVTGLEKAYKIAASERKKEP